MTYEKMKQIEGQHLDRMVLIIGGYAQGQLEYVRQRYEVTDRQVFSACLLDTIRDQDESQDTQTEQLVVIQDFNVWLREEILAAQSHDGMDSETEFEVVAAEKAQKKDSETVIFEQLQRKLGDLLRRYPNVILISDEIGNGLIPMAREERILRDLIGRTQVYLAGQADEVIRVVCGIGQRIK